MTDTATDVDVRELPDPPNEIVRAVSELAVEPAQDGSLATLTGRFSVFNEWAKVDSVFEGLFMERVTPGSFTDSIERDASRYRALFEHGRDATIGNRPLGPIKSLGEDERGAFYNISLLDTEYNRELLPGLKAGLYGSSFRGKVENDTWDYRAARSDHNPEALSERVVSRVSLRDFGPCTFPAYLGATATARSLTDEYIFGQIAQGEGLRRLSEYAKQAKPIEVRTAAATEPPGESPPVERTEPKPEKKEEPEVSVDIDKFTSKGDLVNRQQEIVERQASMDSEYAARALTAEAQTEWDELLEERSAIEARIKHLESREAVVRANGSNPAKVEEERTYHAPNVITESNPFDMAAVRRDSRSVDEEERKLRDNAKRIVERATFPHEKANHEDTQAHVERLLATVDNRAYLSRRIAATGSELYARALGKEIAGAPLTDQERNALAVPMEIERALSLTGSAGGFAVPFVLDPTIIPTSNGAVNPFRQISRVENITVDEWRGVSSAGITAAYAAEATETTDNAPTLAQPTVSTEKAQAFVPFSIEVGQDWDGLQSQMAVLLQDAKDELEAAKFVSGTGTNEPFGVITGATTTVNATTGQTFTIANLYALEEALPPRFRPRASIVANRAIFNRVRQFDTAGGAGLWVDNLGSGLGTTGMTDGRLRQGLLSYPTYESSAMASSPATGNLFMIMGDFRYYLIADRIGLNVETIQHLVGTNHRPTGQRGLYAYWRNGAKVLNAAAFRVMIGIA